MITPKLTAVMLAMTALVGSGAVPAVFAQDDDTATSTANLVNSIRDQINAAEVNVETGGNVQAAEINQGQLADNDVTISNEAESEAEAESGDASRYSESEAEAESEAFAFQSLEDVEIDNEVEQDQDATIVQDLEDQDDVDVDVDQENENDQEVEDNFVLPISIADLGLVL